LLEGRPFFYTDHCCCRKPLS